MKSRRLAQRAGMTLPEVLVVMVLVGLIAATAIPSVSSGYRSKVVSSAAARFVAAHALTRSTALRYGRVAELHVDADAKQFWVQVDTSRTGGVYDTIGTVHDFTDDGLEMSTSRDLLCFDARGLATAIGACDPGNNSVAFSMQERSKTVLTSVLGDVVR